MKNGRSWTFWLNCAGVFRTAIAKMTTTLALKQAGTKRTVVWLRLLRLCFNAWLPGLYPDGRVSGLDAAAFSRLD